MRSLSLTEQQLNALEATFRQNQEDLLSWIFSLLDGSSQPPRWPNALRLVNLDSGEIIYSETLEWQFGETLAKFREQSEST